MGWWVNVRSRVVYNVQIEICVYVRSHMSQQVGGMEVLALSFHLEPVSIEDRSSRYINVHVYLFTKFNLLKIKQYIYKRWTLCSNEPVSMQVFGSWRKRREDWEMKSCGFLVARQPQRSALENFEPSPFLLKVSVTVWTLVWTHQGRMSEVFYRDRWQETLNMSHLSKFNKYVQMKVNPTFSQNFFRNCKKALQNSIFLVENLIMYASSLSLPAISHLWLIIHGCLTIQHRHLKPCMSDSDSQQTIKAK